MPDDLLLTYFDDKGVPGAVRDELLDLLRRVVAALPDASLTRTPLDGRGGGPKDTLATWFTSLVTACAAARGAVGLAAGGIARAARDRTTVTCLGQLSGEGLLGDVTRADVCRALVPRLLDLAGLLGDPPAQAAAAKAHNDLLQGIYTVCLAAVSAVTVDYGEGLSRPIGDGLAFRSVVADELERLDVYLAVGELADRVGEPADPALRYDPARDTPSRWAAWLAPRPQPGAPSQDVVVKVPSRFGGRDTTTDLNVSESTRRVLATDTRGLSPNLEEGRIARALLGQLDTAGSLSRDELAQVAALGVVFTQGMEGKLGPVPTAPTLTPRDPAELTAGPGELAAFGKRAAEAFSSGETDFTDESDEKGVYRRGPQAGSHR